MFWKKCIEHHGFFRCSEVPLTPKQQTTLFSKGSSFRYNGRTQQQLIEYIREHHKRREPFTRPVHSSFSGYHGGSCTPGAGGTRSGMATPGSITSGGGAPGHHGHQAAVAVSSYKDGDTLGRVSARSLPTPLVLPSPFTQQQQQLELQHQQQLQHEYEQGHVDNDVQQHPYVDPNFSQNGHLPGPSQYHEEPGESYPNYQQQHLQEHGNQNEAMNMEHAAYQAGHVDESLNGVDEEPTRTTTVNGFANSQQRQEEHDDPNVQPWSMQQRQQQPGMDDAYEDGHYSDHALSPHHPHEHRHQRHHHQKAEDHPTSHLQRQQEAINDEIKARLQQRASRGLEEERETSDIGDGRGQQQFQAYHDGNARLVESPEQLLLTTREVSTVHIPLDFASSRQPSHPPSRQRQSNTTTDAAVGMVPASYPSTVEPTDRRLQRPAQGQDAETPVLPPPPPSLLDPRSVKNLMVATGSASTSEDEYYRQEQQRRLQQQQQQRHYQQQQKQSRHHKYRVPAEESDSSGNFDATLQQKSAIPPSGATYGHDSPMERLIDVDAAMQSRRTPSAKHGRGRAPSARSGSHRSIDYQSPVVSADESYTPTDSSFDQGSHPTSSPIRQHSSMPPPVHETYMTSMTTATYRLGEAVDDVDDERTTPSLGSTSTGSTVVRHSAGAATVSSVKTTTAQPITAPFTDPSVVIDGDDTDVASEAATPTHQDAPLTGATASVVVSRSHITSVQKVEATFVDALPTIKSTTLTITKLRQSTDADDISMDLGVSESTICRQPSQKSGSTEDTPPLHTSTLSWVPPQDSQGLAKKRPTVPPKPSGLMSVARPSAVIVQPPPTLAGSRMTTAAMNQLVSTGGPCEITSTTAGRGPGSAASFAPLATFPTEDEETDTTATTTGLETPTSTHEDQHLPTAASTSSEADSTPVHLLPDRSETPITSDAYIFGTFDSHVPTTTLPQTFTSSSYMVINPYLKNVPVVRAADPKSVKPVTPFVPRFPGNTPSSSSATSSPSVSGVRGTPTTRPLPVAPPLPPPPPELTSGMISTGAATYTGTSRLDDTRNTEEKHPSQVAISTVTTSLEKPTTPPPPPPRPPSPLGYDTPTTTKQQQQQPEQHSRRQQRGILKTGRSGSAGSSSQIRAAGGGGNVAIHIQSEDTPGVAHRYMSGDIPYVLHMRHVPRSTSSSLATQPSGPGPNGAYRSEPSLTSAMTAYDVSSWTPPPSTRQDEPSSAAVVGDNVVAPPAPPPPQAPPAPPKRRQQHPPPVVYRRQRSMELVFRKRLPSPSAFSTQDHTISPSQPGAGVRPTGATTDVLAAYLLHKRRRETESSSAAASMTKYGSGINNNNNSNVTDRLPAEALARPLERPDDRPNLESAANEALAAAAAVEAARRRMAAVAAQEHAYAITSNAVALAAASAARDVAGEDKPGGTLRTKRRHGRRRNDPRRQTQPLPLTGSLKSFLTSSGGSAADDGDADDDDDDGDGAENVNNTKGKGTKKRKTDKYKPSHLRVRSCKKTYCRSADEALVASAAETSGNLPDARTLPRHSTEANNPDCCTIAVRPRNAQSQPNLPTKRRRRRRGNKKQRHAERRRKTRSKKHPQSRDCHVPNGGTTNGHDVTIGLSADPAGGSTATTALRNEDCAAVTALRNDDSSEVDEDDDDDDDDDSLTASSDSSSSSDEDVERMLYGNARVAIPRSHDDGDEEEEEQGGASADEAHYDLGSQR